MSTKNERITKIKRFLRIQTSPASVSEIHVALEKRMHVTVSRKTIERDMIELTEAGIVETGSGLPIRYKLLRPAEVDLVLKVADIKLLMELLPPGSELTERFRRILDQA